MYEIRIQGTKKVIDKLNRVEEIIKSNDLKVQIAKKSIEIINRLAEERLLFDDNYIKNNKYTIDDKSIVIYNDVVNTRGEHYSLIIEYGSGLWAEKKHIGKSPTFLASGYMFWYVPEDKAPDLSAYPYEKIPTDKGVLYKVYGQTPKHIYEDAAKVIQRNIARWIREYIKKELGGKI